MSARAGGLTVRKYGLRPKKGTQREDLPWPRRMLMSPMAQTQLISSFVLSTASNAAKSTSTFLLNEPGVPQAGVALPYLWNYWALFYTQYTCIRSRWRFQATPTSSSGSQPTWNGVLEMEALQFTQIATTLASDQLLLYSPQAQSKQCPGDAGNPQSSCEFNVNWSLMRDPEHLGTRFMDNLSDPWSGTTDLLVSPTLKPTVTLWSSPIATTKNSYYWRVEVIWDIVFSNNPMLSAPPAP